MADADIATVNIDVSASTIIIKVLLIDILQIMYASRLIKLIMYSVAPVI